MGFGNWNCKFGTWVLNLELGCLVVRAWRLGAGFLPRNGFGREDLLSLRIDWSAGLALGELVMEVIDRLSCHSNTFPDQIAKFLLHLSLPKCDADKQ